MENTQFEGDASIGRHLAIGGDATVAGNISVAHNLTVGGWLEARNIKGVNRGFYETVGQLRQAHPNPLDGWLAGVGSGTPFTAYTSQHGDWRPMVDEDGRIGQITVTMDSIRLERVEHQASTTATEVGALAERMASVEGAVTANVVTASYTIVNRTNTMHSSHFVELAPGHHRVRLSGYPLSGRFGVYQRATDSDAVELLREYSVTDGAIIEFDNTKVRVGFRTWSNDTFRYVVEEVTPLTASAAVEGLRADVNPLVDLAMPWRGRQMLLWGDSVTGISNGNFTPPYEPSCWGSLVAAAHGMAAYYGRGVGGQPWRWVAGGGAAVFVDDEGRYINRAGDNTLDNYTGPLPSGATQVTRGCGCSWHRMCSMIPEAVRPMIDCVVMMYHNDAGVSDTPLEWVEGSTVDPDWAASEHYATYGGDYNINSVRGGIASAVMKMQALLPGAVVVLCTPLSGRGTVGQLNVGARDELMEAVAEMVRQTGCMMSVPVIDVYATCGINGLNRTAYITDTIHPFGIDGQIMLARAVAMGLKVIAPKH